MYSRDYIGKLTEALARALAALAGFKAKAQYKEGIEEIKNTSRQNLDLDLDSLADVPYFKIVAVLKDEKKMSIEQIAAASTLLAHLGEFELADQDSKKALSSTKQALVLIRYVQQNDVKNYSIQRHEQITLLEERIRKINSNT